MFIRPCYRAKERQAARLLGVGGVVSHRARAAAAGGGVSGADGRARAAGREGGGRRRAAIRQKRLFDDVRPQWVEVDAARVRVENCREFGGPWLGLELVRQLGLKEFLERRSRAARRVPWSLMALVLVLCRLCEPSSELYIAEHFYAQSGLAELLGVPAEKINEQRLYRALDALLPHKEALEVHLKNRLGELFGLEYDLLLYDVTSTYFEGEARGQPAGPAGLLAGSSAGLQAGVHRPGGPKGGMPLGYEVFAGNRSGRDDAAGDRRDDGAPLRPGRPDLGDGPGDGQRGEHRVPARKGGRRYIVGTPKSMLKRFERELLCRRLARDPRGAGGQALPVAGGQRRRSSSAAAAIGGRRRRRCTSASSSGSKRGCERIEAACQRQRLDRGRGRPARGTAAGPEQPGRRLVPGRGADRTRWSGDLAAGRRSRPGGTGPP